MSGPTKKGLAVALLASVLCTGVALAQPRGGTSAKDTTIRPPTPFDQPGPPSFFNLLGIALIVGLCVGAAVIPSKRGHQD
ncbi:MAG: hypothetical protein FJ255_05150 [Phycisphaerae bacterium]|nr:hypothetical protein [Phycisphaerae bacterium]